MLKVLAVTGSRADWGLLSPPLALMRGDAAFDLRLAVTGQHLSRQGEASRAAIAAEGFSVDATLDMKLGDDSEQGITRSLGIAVTGFAEIMARIRPDILFVLGDRYEILAPVQAALIARIPVAHLCGGDITEGAVDDSIRHAITKMSHLHFTSNADAAKRVRQMGENPDHIFNVGSPGLDRLGSFSPMPREAFFQMLRLVPRRHNAVVTFHPVTLAADSEAQCAELLAALDSFGSEMGLIFTGVNADAAGRAVQLQIETFVAAHDNAVIVQSMGSDGYFSALTQADLVVGNSSSGLYEAPSFGIATVNIGDRQAGRLMAESVIACAPGRVAIREAIEKALQLNLSKVTNPYGDGHASERIIRVLKGIDHPSRLLRKRFFPI